jgi:FlaA1/EpsC-like NDP-sugar epimerase
MMNLFSKLSTWYFSRKALPYWSIILLDCLVILFSGLLVYALNNGIFATMGIFWHLSLTWGVCLVPYLVGFRLFRTYSGIIRYSSFVDLQRVGFAVLFGVVCVVTFQEFTDFSPYLVYIRKRDLVLSSLLAMSLMWAMRVFVKYFYVTTFRQSKAERAFIFGVKQGGISLAKSIQNQDPAQYVLAGFVSEAGNMQNRILMGVRVYPFDEELIDAMRRERATILFVSPLKSDSIREQPDMVARLAEAGIKIYVTPAAQEWDGRSDLTHTQLRKVEIEDLLPREKIEIDMEAVGRLLRGQRMLIPEACRLVLEAGTMGNGGEIFVFDMGKPVRIIDLAKRMIQLSGAKNVEVRFTGLRAGEKLYEEVLNDEEITLPTFHPKIKIAKVREYDYDTVCQDIDELVGLGRSRDDMAIVGKMKAIVPEFKSRHSKYEVLDG